MLTTTESLSDSTKKDYLLTSLKAARLAHWVYRSNDRPPMEGVRAVVDFDIKETDTQGAAVITETEIYFVFRGTESLKSRAGLRDWKTNLKFIKKVDWFGIKAHRGFAGAARFILSQCGEILDFYPGKRIYFTGHSLGGAVAVLLAVAIVHEFRRTGDRREVRVFTVGQPKVSTRRLLNLALRFVPYVRVTNGSDVVPRIPKVGVSHGGTNLYIPNQSSDDSLEVIWDPSWARQFVNRMFTFRERVRDHSSLDYINQLIKAIR